MPSIIVVSQQAGSDGEEAVVWTERVSAALLESSHFGAQLLERVAWALHDAEAAERRRAGGSP